MSGIVERIPQLLQLTFGRFADNSARSTGFIQRQRGFSGSEFVRVLTFGWLARPRESIDSFASDLGITGSALQQRFTEPASNFLWTVLQSAVAQMVASRPARIPLLAKFQGVYAEDCSTISLPPELANVFPQGGTGIQACVSAAGERPLSSTATASSLTQLRKQSDPSDLKPFRLSS